MTTTNKPLPVRGIGSLALLLMIPLLPETRGRELAMSSNTLPKLSAA